MSSSGTPAVGDLYQRELLQSQAIYRVIAVEDEHVQMETVDVPGLPPGHPVRLTIDSLGRMTRMVTPSEAPDSVAQRAEQPRRSSGASPRLATP